MSWTRALVPLAFALALLGLRALIATDPRDRLAPAAADVKDPPGTTAATGTLAITRGGPVIIGFQSDGPAHLSIAGHELIGQGLLVKDRIVIPAGPTAIRFAGPPDARLVWSPVGRRGDPEYVPASSLSPDPPERATFDHPGTARLDGIIAAALLALVVGSLLYLARARLTAMPRDMWIAIASVFAVGCIVRWIDLSGHGQTWDEDVNWAAGRNYITNLLSFDFRARSWAWNFEHPPVMKYLEGIGAQLADGFGPARALSAIWTALGCALLVPIGTRLYSLRVGVLAAAIAALLPPLVAHGQIVGHESPTVLWWTLGTLLALGAVDDLARIRIRLFWVGVVIGVAVASRFVNGLLGPLCLVIVVTRAWPSYRLRVLRDAIVIMPVVALATLYAIWPRLWPYPIAALEDSFAKLSRGHGGEPFLGVMTDHPGLHYFPLYLLATLPVGVLAGALLWSARVARDRTTLIVAAMLLIPLGVALSPVRQDGVRYVMPCITALALIAAAGWDTAATWLRHRHAFPALAGAIVVYLAIVLARIHPYYLDYFGEQVGGTGTVTSHHWFETAWWGEGVDRAVTYVNEHAAPGAHVFRDCIEPSHLAWFRQDLWDPMVRTIDQAEWVVAYAPQTHYCPVPPTMHRVFSVDADGATLAEVWTR